METNAKIKEKREKYVKEKVSASIGEQCAKIKSKDVKERLYKALNECQANGLLSDYDSPNTKARSLWSSWSIKQKAAWFWKNKLGFGKKEIETFKRMGQFVERLGDLFYDEFYVDLSVAPYDEFVGEFHKYWYESTPKSVVIFESEIILASPVKSVVIKGSINI